MKQSYHEMAECDCPSPHECVIAGECLAREQCHEDDAFPSDEFVHVVRAFLILVALSAALTVSAFVVWVL